MLMSSKQYIEKGDDIVAHISLDYFKCSVIFPLHKFIDTVGTTSRLNETRQSQI